MRKSIVSKYKVGELLKSLTAKQQLFVIYFVETSNATQSAIAAGYSKKSAEVQGSKLMRNKKVADVVGELRRRMLEDSLLTAEQVMEQLSYLILRDPIDLVDEDGYLHTDISKMPERIRCCIDAVEQETSYDSEGNQVIKSKIKLSPKAPAVDMGLKVFRAYEDRKEETSKVSINWEEFWKAKAKGDPIEIKLLEADKPKRKKK